MFVPIAPHPRSRIYTTYKSYLSFFTNIFLGRIRRGDDVYKLERLLAEKLNIHHAVCVPMDRVGIYFSVKNLIKPGQGVIMSPYTIVDVVNMVISAGGVPIFADTEKKSGNIDPGKIEQLIDDNIGAVLITHLHGISASALEILSICQKHQLPLIEDTAQALGAKEDNKFLGTIGTVGVFSFGMYKNINCWYGGAVVSNDKVLIDKIRNDLEHYNYSSAWFIFKRILKGLVTDLLTTPIFFRLFIFWVFRYGFLNNIRAINKWMETELDLKLHNTIPSHYLTRLTPWQARLVLLQLDKIEIHKQSRVVRAKMYYEGLKDLDGLVLPKDINNSSNSYLSFPIQYYDRNKLLKWLMLNNRDIAAQHFKNCADLPDFHAYHRDCPVARKTATEMILLPTYPRYPISEVKKNIKVIRSFFTETGDK